MEHSPTYQGNTFAPARASQGKVSADIPFQDAFMQGLRHVANNHAQLEQALQERHDDTQLNKQEAEQKANAINLANKLKEASLAAPGTEGSLYNADGTVNKDSVKSLANTYIEPSKKWGKTVIDPAKRQAAGESAQAYQLGVANAINSHLLASTKTNQRRAYDDNYDLALKSGNTGEAVRVARRGVKNRVYSPAQAAKKELDALNQQFYNEVTQITSPTEAIAILDQYPDLKAKNPKAYSHLQSVIKGSATSGKASGAVYTTDKKGNRTLSRTPVEPPADAPTYVRDHWLKYEGHFDKKDPDCIKDSYSVIQRWLNEEVDTPEGTPKGDEQYQAARALATSIGIDATSFDNAYETRKKQLSTGGFNPSKHLALITDQEWLSVTNRDEQWQKLVDSGEWSQSTYNSEISKLISDLRKEVLEEYNDWCYHNKAKNLTEAEQVVAFQNIARNAFATKHDIVKRIMEPYLKRERDVAYEIAQTKARRQISRAESPDSPSPAQKTATTPFKCDLMQGKVANDLPDSQTKCIIYYPHGEKLPADKISISWKNGSYSTDIEFRHSKSISLPAMSLKLRQVLKCWNRNPDSISWDGKSLILGDNEAPPAEKQPTSLFPEGDVWVEKKATADNQSVPSPDDGLVPPDQTGEETAEEVPDEEATPLSDIPVNDGKIPPWLKENDISDDIPAEITTE